MARRMEDLFQRPLPELREAFIRARFAEEQVFGRPDIETWLAREREAERPDYDSDGVGGWSTVFENELLQFVAGHRELTALRECATPQPQLQLDALRPHAGDIARAHGLARAMIRVLDPRSVDVFDAYYHGADEPTIAIVMLRKMGDLPGFAYYSRGGPHDPLEIDDFVSYGTKGVIDVLFAEWLYGRLRWKEARQFLCDAVAGRIQDERNRAIVDFDLAVAISQDGTEIVDADWVVVPYKGPRLGAGTRIKMYGGVPDDLRVRIYHGADFFDARRKVLIAPDPNARGSVRCEGTAEEFLRTCDPPSVALSGPFGTTLLTGLGPKPSQVLIRTGDKKKILVTHADLVPEME